MFHNAFFGIQRCRIAEMNNLPTSYSAEKKSFDCIFFAENCSDPSKDTNAKVIGDVFSHGNEVKFVCPKDYILIPESSEILTCDDGKWNGMLPSCKGMTIMMCWKTFDRPTQSIFNPVLFIILVIDLIVLQ
jgi:hypothetical protein